MREETGLEAEKLELIGITQNPEKRSTVYAYLAVVNCAKDAISLQEGETVDYRWTEPEAFLSLIPREPVLQIQYRRYKSYLDQLGIG